MGWKFRRPPQVFLCLLTYLLPPRNQHIYSLAFPGGSDGKVSVYNVRDLGSIPGLGGFPGEGNGNPLQYSCLENPINGGAWRRLLSMGSQRVGNDWATSLFTIIQEMHGLAPGYGHKWLNTGYVLKVESIGLVLWWSMRKMEGTAMTSSFQSLAARKWDYYWDEDRQ